MELGVTRIYINGVFNGEYKFGPKSKTQPLYNTTWRMGIASPENDAYPFPSHGIIDEVLMYNRAFFEEEIRGLQGSIPLDAVSSFSKREITALQYAKALSGTPISLPSSLITTIKNTFHEREIVIIASTIAQVNYWARLIQGLGIAPEGFTKECSLLHLEKYKTLQKQD